MANGSEVVLGWGIADYARIREALGIRIPLTDDEWIALNEKGNEEYLATKATRRINKLLLEAHSECVGTLGELKGVDQERYSIVETALGQRSFSPFKIELHYDPSEMGEEPEHTTFGVALSGRYFPTFLDWKDPSGALWPVRFDAELNGLIAVARTAIEKRIPIFSTAHIAVIEKHY
jgi:hypothetical protein